MPDFPDTDPSSEWEEYTRTTQGDARWLYLAIVVSWIAIIGGLVLWLY